MSTLVPKYTFWEAVQAALAIGTKALEEVRDLARLPGPRGKDGFGFDDLDMVENERGVFLRFKRGDEMKEFRLPIVTDRGVWKEGTYRKGDGVTWGGSFWICQVDETSDKPDSGKGFRLAVKKGRDGKDGIIKAAADLKPVKIG